MGLRIRSDGLIEKVLTTCLGFASFCCSPVIPESVGAVRTKKSASKDSSFQHVQFQVCESVMGNS